MFSGMDASTKGTDAALKTLQKGVIAALAAMVPIGSLMIARGESDAQLDNLAGNALDAMKTLALVSNGLGTRRKEMIKAGMQGIYAKALPRASGGSPEWLFGGNVAETAKQCETAQRLSEKIMRGKAGRQRGGAKPDRRPYSQRGFDFPPVWPAFGQSYGYGQAMFEQRQSFKPRATWRQTPAAAGTPQKQDFQKKGPQK